MIRKAFVMSLLPGNEAEYARRHSPIWPELEEVFRDHGVRTYSIFLHPETHQLFAFAEIENEEHWAAIASTEACQRWWVHMRPLMETHPDNSPISTPLREVFRFDGSPAEGDLRIY